MLLPLDPTFTLPQLNTMSCRSHTMCHNPLGIMICGAKKGPEYGKTSQPWSQSGLSGQGSVPKLSKFLDGPSCKFSNAFVFILHPILLAGFGLQHFGLELNMAKFQPQGPASQTKAHMPGGHRGRRDIYSSPTARTAAKSSQRGFPWLERKKCWVLAPAKNKYSTYSLQYFKNFSSIFCKHGDFGAWGRFAGQGPWECTLITPAHVAQHNHIICTQESISEPGVHRAQEQPWELPATPWALGELLHRKGSS